ncbi:MAG: histidine triad nucleotide-binding protein [Patescibacteria group bacterium]|nr:MAG: histidine triad nucleotide-binding protein [Patescibacteria group bacterium]
MLRKDERQIKPEPDCIFCKIIRKEIGAEIVYEDDKFSVFKDANPSAPTHLLIVPKEHLELVGGDLEKRADVLGRIFALSRKVAADAGVLKSGYKLVTNAGRGAGQTVDHLHIHLIGGWESPDEVRHV